MYLMGSDTYVCDYCGLEEKWDEHDDHRGDIWECENCMTHFCTRCFVDRQGGEAFYRMLSETDYVLCPHCFKENAFGVKDELKS